MAWRGVHISQSARLSVRDRQLIVSQGEDEVALAIEDLAWVVLDTAQVTVTGAVLSALADNGIVMIVPDDRHHPAGVLLPFHRHHAQAGVAHIQAAIGQPLRKRLWQALVVAKIENQAGHLRRLARPAANAVQAMAGRVVSGDPDNIEAQAARAYWSALFDDFTRGDGADRRNALLNYGYAVVRAALARACVACGLLPAFGVHHASRANAFNLVDDLIEPLRAFVDRVAWERHAAAGAGELDLADRQHMASVLNVEVWMGTERMTMLAATEVIATTTVRAMELNSAALLQLPSWTTPARTRPS